MLKVDSDAQRLVYSYDSEILWIEPWGQNSLRVRATKNYAFPNQDWALQECTSPACELEVSEATGTIKNGNIRATVTSSGKISIFNQHDKPILEEYVRNRNDVTDPKCSAILVDAREFKSRQGTENYHLTMRFESLDRNERIFGMGQYQLPDLDLKGLDLELAHRNSQASVPFAVSSLGYGFLWNNPGVGRVVFGKNTTSFEAYSTKVLDYWITAADTPAEIIQTHSAVTGTPPMMPEYGLGFWQCKLRYQTQDELLGIARKHVGLGLPLDVIVVDFFHWPYQGEWKFDPTYWPDPDKMIAELKEMGIELMVSIWPTVDKRSENFQDMLEKGFLVRTDRGIRTMMDFEGETVHYDATNPQAQKYLWNIVDQNYYQKGVKLFWLDEAEPEYTVYDFENYRYYLGSNLEIGNHYPVAYAQTFYEGMTSKGQNNVVNLIRCAWAGSQKYGTLVWSGDIASSWSSLRNQLSAGLNMGIAGIPYWTTDIGGFHGGDPNDPDFRELFVRWFQWATFCPVMRLHGDREPRQPQHGTTGGATCRSGADNEVWSYGPEIFEICKKYILLRETLRDYTRDLMKDAHEQGSPLMRPLFYDFPKDRRCWEIDDQYMYGSKYLCAPILEAGQRTRKVYLPTGYSWQLHDSEDRWDGGQQIDVSCPLDTMPVFSRVTSI